MFQTPILFIIFNRPDTSAIVFQKIREIKPRQLFIAADGARQDKPGEKERCQQTRDLILEGVDWECEVKTLFRDQNVGCGRACSGAVNWFFENVEQGIILEDDCVPDLSFFSYCENLLDYYKDNEKVMHISGNNFQLSYTSEHSYYFSSSCYIWGWATWRRAWKLYDFQMTNYTNSWDFSEYVAGYDEVSYWRNIFSLTKKGLIDTWDYQWFFSCWYHKGLSIMPQYNLVTNIGFRPDATHTKWDIFIISNMKRYCINELNHPPLVARNKMADYWHSRILNLYKANKLISFSQKLLRKIRVIVKLPMSKNAITT